MSGFVPRNGTETPKGHRPLQAKCLALETAKKMIFLFEYGLFWNLLMKIKNDPNYEICSREPRRKPGSGWLLLRVNLGKGADALDPWGLWV